MKNIKINTNNKVKQRRKEDKNMLWQTCCMRKRRNDLNCLLISMEGRVTNNVNGSKFTKGVRLI